MKSLASHHRKRLERAVAVPDGQVGREGRRLTRVGQAVGA